MQAVSVSPKKDIYKGRFKRKKYLAAVKIKKYLARLTPEIVCNRFFFFFASKDKRSK